MATSTNQSKATTHTTSIWRQILHGQVVSNDFFTRNWLAIVVVMLLLLAYISSRYVCLTKMERVQQLNKQLEVARAEQMNESGRYMGQILESSMRERLDTMHLDLRIQENPPYILPPK